VDLLLRYKPVFIYDISLPIASMEPYLANVKQTLQTHWPNVIVYAYGHLADGNLHIGVVPQPESYVNNASGTHFESTPLTDEQQDWYQTCNKIMFEPLEAIGGTVSAEHGIGLMKKPYLHYSRTGAEISMMNMLKKAMDPTNILNPGKIVGDDMPV